MNISAERERSEAREARRAMKDACHSQQTIPTSIVAKPSKKKSVRQRVSQPMWSILRMAEARRPEEATMRRGERTTSQSTTLRRPDIRQLKVILLTSECTSERSTTEEKRDAESPRAMARQK